MKFYYKAFLYRILERMPYGSEFYYFIQKNMTKSLRYDKRIFINSCNDCIHDFVNPFIKEYSGDTGEAVVYEFGSGWNLRMPAVFSLMAGVKEFYAADLNPLLQRREIIGTLKYFMKYKRILDKIPVLDHNKSVCEKRYKSLKEYWSGNAGYQTDQIISLLNTVLQIKYLAPYDARNAHFENEAVDCIVSCATLEHISSKDIMLILKECQRILKKNGVMIFIIDYKDHWSYTDHKITPYNFLRFSQSEWKKYNVSMHYQNRLRHSDYIRLITNAGFEIILEEKNPVSEKDRFHLSKIQLDDSFKHYSEEDLLIQGARMVIKKM